LTCSPSISSDYGGKMNDLCIQCHQELKVKCPVCGRLVLVSKGLVAAHDTATVHAGHVTWGSCKGSRSKYIVVEHSRPIPAELVALAGDAFTKRAIEVGSQIKPLTDQAYSELGNGADVFGSDKGSL